MNKDFLWGGAVAAHQVEGAYLDGQKGLSIADVMTSGTSDQARKITAGIKDGEYYPNHNAIFIITTKKILNYLLKWVLNVLERQLLGRDYFQKVTKKYRMKKA